MASGDPFMDAVLPAAAPTSTNAGAATADPFMDAVKPSSPVASNGGVFASASRFAQDAMRQAQTAFPPAPPARPMEPDADDPALESDYDDPASQGTTYSREQNRALRKQRETEDAASNLARQRGLTPAKLVKGPEGRMPEGTAWEYFGKTLIGTTGEAAKQAYLSAEEATADTWRGHGAQAPERFADFVKDQARQGLRQTKEEADERSNIAFAKHALKSGERVAESIDANNLAYGEPTIPQRLSRGMAKELQAVVGLPVAAVGSLFQSTPPRDQAEGIVRAVTDAVPNTLQRLEDYVTTDAALDSPLGAAADAFMAGSLLKAGAGALSRGLGTAADKAAGGAALETVEKVRPGQKFVLPGEVDARAGNVFGPEDALRVAEERAAKHGMEAQRLASEVKSKGAEIKAARRAAKVEARASTGTRQEFTDTVAKAAKSEPAAVDAAVAARRDAALATPAAEKVAGLNGEMKGLQAQRETARRLRQTYQDAAEGVRRSTIKDPVRQVRGDVGGKARALARASEVFGKVERLLGAAADNVGPFATPNAIKRGVLRRFQGDSPAPGKVPGGAKARQFLMDRNRPEVKPWLGMQRNRDAPLYDLDFALNDLLSNATKGEWDQIRRIWTYDDALTLEGELVSSLVSRDMKQPHGQRFAVKPGLTPVQATAARGLADVGNRYGRLLDIVQDQTRRSVQAEVLAKQTIENLRKEGRISKGPLTPQDAQRVIDEAGLHEVWAPQTYTDPKRAAALRERLIARGADPEVALLHANELLERPDAARASSGGVSGRGAMGREMGDLPEDVRVNEYGQSTDLRDMVAAVMRQERDIANANMWSTAPPTVVSTVQKMGWVERSNAAIPGTGGVRRYGTLPDRFWVHPDVAADIEAMEKFLRHLDTEGALGKLRAAQRGLLKSYTVYNPGTWGTNVLGNGLYLGPMHGFSPLTNPRDAMVLAETVKEFATGKLSPETRELTRRGIRGPGWTTTGGDIGDADAATGLILSRVTTAREPLQAAWDLAHNGLEKVGHILDTIDGKVTRFYRTQDDVYRIAAAKRDLRAGMGVDAAVDKWRAAFADPEHLSGLMRALAINDGLFSIPFVAWPARVLPMSLAWAKRDPFRAALYFHLFDAITDANAADSGINWGEWERNQSPRRRLSQIPLGALIPPLARDDAGNIRRWGIGKYTPASAVAVNPGEDVDAPLWRNLAGNPGMDIGLKMRGYNAKLDREVPGDFLERTTTAVAEASPPMLPPYGYGASRVIDAAQGDVSSRGGRDHAETLGEALTYALTGVDLGTDSPGELAAQKERNLRPREDAETQIGRDVQDFAQGRIGETFLRRRLAAAKRRLPDLDVEAQVARAKAERDAQSFGTYVRGKAEEVMAPLPRRNPGALRR